MPPRENNNNRRRQPNTRKQEEPAHAEQQQSDAGSAPAAAAAAASEDISSSLPQQQQQQPKPEKPKNIITIPAPKPATSLNEETIECSLCSDPIEAFGVFDCGHFACYKCALRIRRSFRRDTSSSSRSSNSNNNRRGYRSIPVVDNTSSGDTKGPCKCHVCRSVITSLVITEMIPTKPDSMQYDKNELSILSPSNNGAKKFIPLNCFVTSDTCAARLVALISLVCPFDQCWDMEMDGSKSQETFNNLEGLQRHLRQDHSGSKYCEICVGQGYSFLCELAVYTPSELVAHMRGTNTNKDISAFGGHPQCEFCHNKTLYDGDAMLEHLKLVHYVCDFCNINSYKFIYYNDREALNRHWAVEHKVCSHPECAQMDASERVFANELELSKHMQNRHNVKQKVSLSELGFTSAAEQTIPSRGGGAAAAAQALAEERLATQAAAQLSTVITYDYVGRTVVVPLIPKVAYQQPEQQQQNSRRNPPSGRRQPPPQKQQQAQNDDDSQQQQPSSPATVPSSSSSSSAAPTDAQEADGLLRRILHEKLKPHQAKDFQNATVQYLKQQIKAIEYFTKLQSLFPDEETLSTVHACMVQTLRAKKNDMAPSSAADGKDLLEALVQAKALVMSVESQRAKAAQADDDKKRKQAEVRKAHQAVLLGTNKSGKNVLQYSSGAGGTGGNAWQQRAQEKGALDALNTGGGGGSAAAAVRSQPQSPGGKKWGPSPLTVNAKPQWDQAGNSAPPVRPKSPQAQTQLARSAGGAAAAAASSPSLGDAFPEAFPGLNTTTRKGNVHPNQPAKVKGAWTSNRLV